MPQISYADFIATAPEAHLNLLASFTAATRIREPVANVAAITKLRDGAQALFDQELLTRVSEGKERDSAGVVWITFDGYVSPVANGYVDRAARERIQLSRAPVPVTPPPAPAGPPT